MERLTRREIGGVVFVGETISDRRAAAGRALNRLAAYEDTGLEPEEIERLQEYMKPFTIQDMDRFREIMDAEKDGRLVVLPCKLTDTVYIVESVMRGKKHIGEKIVSAQIDHVTIGESGNPVLDVRTETGNWYGPLETSDFWTTRQEAEDALRKEAENG